MVGGPDNGVVHLELLTGDLPGARAYDGALCGWRTERIDTAHGSYTALGMGAARGRHRRVRDRAALVAALRRGARHPGGDDPGGRARGAAPARPARGAGRVAQRDRHRVRGRDRPLAAQAMSSTAPRGLRQ